MSFGFNFDNAFDLGGRFGGRARHAIYPPLSEPETDTAVQQLTRGSLSSLGYVGSTLDKWMGDRAIRGLLGGKPRELLSVIPGSDVFGLTDESDIVSGGNLWQQATGRDPSQGGWLERNIAGPALEVALSPSSYLGGIGALTKAGKAAAKVGAVTPGFLASVRAGERSVHPLVAAASKIAPFKNAQGVPLAQLGAARGLELAGQAAKGINVGVRKAVPGVAPFEDLVGAGAKWANVGRKSLFERSAGPVPHPTVQEDYKAIKHAGDLEAARITRTHNVDINKATRELIAETGYPPDKVQRYLDQYRENLIPDEPIIGPHNVGVARGLGMIGEELKKVGRTDPAALEQQAGMQFHPFQTTADAGYGARRRYALPGKFGIWEALKDVFGARARLLPTTHGSMQRRLESIRNWYGGTRAIEDLMVPELAGAKPTLSPGKVLHTLIQDQIDKIQQGAFLASQHAGAPVPTILPIGPAKLKEITGWAKGMRRFLKTISPENIEGGIAGMPRVPYFNPDPIAMSVMRKKLALEGKASADTIFSLIGKLTPRQRGLAAPGAAASTDVPISEILRRTRLDTEQGLHRATRAVGIDPAVHLQQVLAAAQQGNPNATIDAAAELKKLLGQYSMPQFPGDQISKLINRYQTPEEIKPWLKLLDAWQNTWKTGVYTVWPGSLLRNVGSGTFENTAASGLYPGLGGRYGAARRAQLGKNEIETGIPGWSHLTPAEQGEQVRRSAYIEGVDRAKQGEMAEQVGLAPPGTAAGDPLSPHPSIPALLGQMGPAFRKMGAGLRQPGFKAKAGAVGGLVGDWSRVMQALGETAENRMRVGQFAHLLKQGWDPKEAAKQVAATHFDYHDLSDFENRVMKRLIPFYTFPRKNLPKQIKRAVQDPFWTESPLRFSGMMQDEQQGNYVPEYLRGGVSLPLGESAPGYERYLSSLGIPLEEAFGRLKVDEGPVKTLGKTGEAYLGLLRPEIRAPLEYLTGRQFFTGRDLKDLHVGKLESLASLGDEESGRLISQLVSATPASRALSTVNRLLDERKYVGGPMKSAVAQLLPLLSGARITDVDIEKWRAIDARNQLEKMLASAQHVRENRDYYADKRARLAGEVTPQEEQMLRTYASLKRRATEAIEAKRRVGVLTGGGQ